MVMPKDVELVDTMVGFPHADMQAAYRFITRQTKDEESKFEFEFPVEYIFKDVPRQGPQGIVRTPSGVTLREMDLWGIERAWSAPTTRPALGAEALQAVPRPVHSVGVRRPQRGMEGIRRLVQKYETYGLRAVGIFPAGHVPPGRHQRQEDVPDLCQMR